jgi:hypothetical protein
LCPTDSAICQGKYRIIIRAGLFLKLNQDIGEGWKSLGK